MHPFSDRRRCTSSPPLFAIHPADLRARVATRRQTGIGAIIAETLAASGATVYITGRRKEVIEDEAKHAPAGGKIVPIQMDVNNVENVQEVAKEIAAKESHLNLSVLASCSACEGAIV